MARFAHVLFPSLLLIAFTAIVIAEEKKPQPYTEKLPGRGATVTFDMVPIPGGTFTMKIGDEEKQVTVKPFWIGKTEVTWQEYDVFYEGWDLPTASDPKTHMVAMIPFRETTKTRPSQPYGKTPDDDFGHNGYPVIRAHYHAAVMYCKWLSEKTGKKYRLPTEAEWEWACRGGADGGKLDAKELEQNAWFNANAVPEGAFDPQTGPVAKKKPNGYGLHDMLGNVAEWTAAADGTDDTPEEKRYVTKGGSFRNPPTALHAGFRQFSSPAWLLRHANEPKSRWWYSDANWVGLRVVRED